MAGRSLARSAFVDSPLAHKPLSRVTGETSRYSRTLCAPAVVRRHRGSRGGRQRLFFFLWHLCDGPSDAHCRRSGRHLFTVRNPGSGDLQASASAVSTSVGSGPFPCSAAAAAAAAAASEPRPGGAGGTIIQGGSLHGAVPPGARLRCGERNIRTFRSTKD